MYWAVISAMDSSVCTDEEKAMELWTQAVDLGSWILGPVDNGCFCFSAWCLCCRY